MREFTAEDSLWLCEYKSINNHAVVISPSAIPRYGQGQIFFCIGGEGAETNVGRYLAPLVSLSTGELCHVRCEDVLGALKQELLPDEARLHLSQLRPADALDLKTHTPEYSGYSFLPDGRYAAGVWLCSSQEVWGYVQMQKDYQHRVLICDRDDFAVLEMVKGKLLYPDEQALLEFSKSQESDAGMRMG